jgi:flavorubredoxin
METRINEIASGIYRLSTFVPEIAPPAGFTFNQFLILGDEPLLFHTGLRRMFPLVREAVSRLIPPDSCAGSPSATMRPMSAAR